MKNKIILMTAIFLLGLVLISGVVFGETLVNLADTAGVIAKNTVGPKSTAGSETESGYSKIMSDLAKQERSGNNRQMADLYNSLSTQTDAVILSDSSQVTLTKNDRAQFAEQAGKYYVRAATELETQAAAAYEKDPKSQDTKTLYDDAKKLRESAWENYNSAGKNYFSTSQKDSGRVMALAFQAKVDGIDNDMTLSQSEKNEQIDKFYEEMEFDKANEDLERDTSLSAEDKATAKHYLDVIGNIKYVNQRPAWMESVRSFFNGLNYWFEGYSGASFFYSDDAAENSIYNQMDEGVLKSALNGIPGIASEICKGDVLEDIDGSNGYSFSDSVTGASAHIEGAKVTVLNYSLTNNTNDTGSLRTVYYYKITFAVSPGQSTTGCNLGFSAYLGRGTTPLIVANGTSTAYGFEVERGDDAIDYTGNNMIVQPSLTSYSEVCIKFESIGSSSAGSCLIGINQGDYLCNTLQENSQQSYNDFRCDNCPSLLSSGGSYRTTSTSSSSSSSTTSSSSSSSSSSTSTSSPAVNTNI
jgi:hypothetical protein